MELTAIRRGVGRSILVSLGQVDAANVRRLHAARYRCLSDSRVAARLTWDAVSYANRAGSPLTRDIAKGAYAGIVTRPTGKRGNGLRPNSRNPPTIFGPPRASNLRFEKG